MKILIIDDERSIRNSLKEILADEGYDVDVAENGSQGCEMADKEKYSVIFCDIKMPGMDGMEVLDRFAEMGIDSAVVMISGHGDIDTAVECIKKGAFDFIQKPLDLNRILITIKNATEKVSLVKETRILKKKVYGQEIVGESDAIRQVQGMIDKVAPTDARVLIIGSNGTGKELVARNKGNAFVISPWALTWDDENYYMLGYDELTDLVKHYRVDKMQRISIIDDDREGAEAFVHFDLAKFAKSTFGMYGGKPKTVTLECENSLIGTILDRFGTDVIIQKVDDEHFCFCHEVAVSGQFYGWVTGLGAGVKIKSPQHVVDGFKEWIDQIRENL